MPNIIGHLRLITAVDIAARAYSSAFRASPPPPTLPAPAAPAAAEPTGGPITVTHVVGGRDTGGWQVHAVMSDHAIIVKQGQSPRRVLLDELVVERPLAGTR